MKTLFLYVRLAVALTGATLFVIGLWDLSAFLAIGIVSLALSLLAETLFGK